MANPIPAAQPPVVVPVVNPPVVNPPVQQPAVPVVQPVVPGSPEDIAQKKAEHAAEVAEAVNLLSKTALENYRNEVDQKTGISYVGNKIAYFFKRIQYALGFGDLAAADKEFSASIKEFNKASENLIVAVANRGIRKNEVSEPIAPRGQREIDALVEEDDTVNEALDAFYAQFKKRVTQIPDANDAFGLFAEAASKIIADTSVSKSIQKKFTGKSISVMTPLVPGVAATWRGAPELINLKGLQRKIPTTIEAFETKVFVDIAATYASQPLKDCFKTLKETVEYIKSVLKLDNAAIEFGLRQAIKKEHNDADFNDLIEKYSSTVNNDTNEPLKAAKKAVKDKFEGEKATFEARLAALRGANAAGDNGLIHTADEEFKKARNEKDAALAKFKVEAHILGNSNDEADAILAAYNSPDARIRATGEDLRVKNETFKAKKTALEALVKEFDEIAVFPRGVTDVAGITGGKLKVVNDNLSDAAVLAAAKFETAKVADFYAELQKDIIVNGNESLNKAERTKASKALNDIINRKPGDVAPQVNVNEADVVAQLANAFGYNVDAAQIGNAIGGLKQIIGAAVARQAQTA
jgi:hypothetical protein